MENKSKLGDLSQYKLETEFYVDNNQWREKRWRDKKSRKVVRFETRSGFFWERTYNEKGEETSCYTNLGGWEEVKTPVKLKKKTN